MLHRLGFLVWPFFYPRPPCLLSVELLYDINLEYFFNSGYITDVGLVASGGEVVGGVGLETIFFIKAYRFF